MSADEKYQLILVSIGCGCAVLVSLVICVAWVVSVVGG
jgi:hypothetical protein